MRVLLSDCLTSHLPFFSPPLVEMLGLFGLSASTRAEVKASQDARVSAATALNPEASIMDAVTLVPGFSQGEIKAKKKKDKKAALEKLAKASKKAAKAAKPSKVSKPRVCKFVPRAPRSGDLGFILDYVKTNTPSTSAAEEVVRKFRVFRQDHCSGESGETSYLLWLAQLVQSGLAPSTINSYSIIVAKALKLTQFLRQALKATARVAADHASRQAVKLSHEQLRDMIVAARPHEKLVLYMLYCTAGRPADLQRLRGSQISADSEYIHVEFRLTKGIRKPKGSSRALH
jgi:integrase